MIFQSRGRPQGNGDKTDLRLFSTDLPILHRQDPFKVNLVWGTKVSFVPVAPRAAPALNYFIFIFLINEGQFCPRCPAGGPGLKKSLFF